MISISDTQCMIDRYDSIGKVTSNQVTVIQKKKKTIIHGFELKIVMLSKYEVVVEGKLTSIEFNYD